jgi:hypothetical protein
MSVNRESEDDIVVTACQEKNLVVKELQVRKSQKSHHHLLDNQQLLIHYQENQSTIKDREAVQNNVADNKIISFEWIKVKYIMMKKQHRKHKKLKV